ncbi:7960_t:CDS:1, partial [Scutellospora calospora]
MPSIRKFSSLNFKGYITKFLSDIKFNNMLYNFATPESPGFKYLYLFKEEFHANMAEILKEGPTIHRVCKIILQNLDKKMLAEYKIKPIRFDEMKVFNIEVSEPEDWDPN